MGPSDIKSEEKPKRPQNAFTLFVADQREKILK
jgi:hypothetical protein